MSKRIDLTGQRFGRLIVRSMIWGEKITYCVAECVCERNVSKIVAAGSLKNGRTKSCGCLFSELTSLRMSSHRQTNTRKYSQWRNMKNRCYNPKSINYSYYGGRGIGMCKDWRESYEKYDAWSDANGYRDDLEIDRINPYGDYMPCNCRFVTKAQNRARTVKTKKPKRDSKGKFI